MAKARRQQVMPSDVLLGELAASTARVEALLRVALRRQIANAVPPPWLKGRKRKILDFCRRPHTQQEIRAHVGSIAGYEMRNHLDEGIGLGLLARYTVADGERFETVVSLQAQKRRTSQSTRSKAN